MPKWPGSGSASKCPKVIRFLLQFVNKRCACQSAPKFAKVRQSAPKCAKVRQSAPKCAKVCHALVWPAVCLIQSCHRQSVTFGQLLAQRAGGVLSQSAKRQSTLKCAKVRQSASKCANVRQRAPKCANERPRHECQSGLGQVQPQSVQKSYVFYCNL